MRYFILCLFTLAPVVFGAPATAERVDVAALQRALAALGYQPGLVNGEWGVETRGALFQFQRDNGFRTSLDVDAEQRRLLGIDVSAAPASQPAVTIDLEPASPIPIVGDLNATMKLYGTLASHIIFKTLRETAFISTVTTQSHPAEVTFVPPEPIKGFANIFSLGDAPYETSGVTLAAQKLRHKSGAALVVPDLTELSMQGETLDSLCDDVPNGPGTVNSAYVCITSGNLVFGGTFKLGDNIVSCQEGRMTITDANKRQTFAPGALCRVNGNPVRLSDNGWIKDAD